MKINPIIVWIHWQADWSLFQILSIISITNTLQVALFLFCGSEQTDPKDPNLFRYLSEKFGS